MKASLSTLRVRALVPALSVLLLLAGGAYSPAHSQECGIAAGQFQIDGQFYSSSGYIDWAQGPAGQGVFDGSGMPLLSPSLYDRDPHWAGGAVDPDHFAGEGNKNDDYIGLGEEPWTWGPGNGPQKNDLTDIYAYSIVMNDEIWLILGACTRANNGSSHIDFEFNQQGFYKTGETSGLVVGNGPDGGRTAGVDFIVSVDYTSGGTVPVASFRRWLATGSDFGFVAVTPDPGQVYACTNTTTVPAPPWGAVAPDGSAATEVIPYQFVEVAMNLTLLQIDPSVFCTDVSTLLFKTRSAASFTASLKDLALYQFSIIPPPECAITYDDDSICDGETATFCGPEGDLTYTWTGPEGFTSGDRCIEIDVPGVYELMLLDNLSGCEGGPCSHELIVNSPPPCDISYDDDAICDGGSAQFCGPEAPYGSTYTYEWHGPGEPYSNQRCITVTQDGLYTLDVTDDSTGCSSTSTCEQYLTVHQLPPCDIQGPPFICSGFDAELCGPEDDDYSYEWDGPSPPYPDTSCITVDETGTYTLTVTDNVTRCSSGTCEHELQVGDPPPCEITGPDAICDGDEGRLCGPEGDYTYEWEGPGGDYPDTRCITVTEEGTYGLRVEDQYGCVSTCDHTLAVNNGTEAGELTDLWLCTGERAEFCVEVTGTPPFSYVWRKDGEVIAGATDSCYVIDSITAGDVGEYCVQVQGLCGDPLRRCAELTLADVTISELNDLFLCPDQSGEFCVTPSGKGPFSYQWKQNGEVIPGATDSCYAVEAATESDEGIYCVVVQGACGDPVEGCGILIVGTCELFCTKTQGFYGNYGGKWHGMTTLELLQSLITSQSPLVVGVVGKRSVTFPDGAERCVIELLPAGGPPAALKQPMGDLTIDPVTCDVGQHFPLKNGRIRNILLGQTITLSLNTRLDPFLSNLPICELMIAVPALPGPDGILGTEDDVPDPNAEPRIRWIPESVLDALSALSLPQTAGGLLELANLGLAGEDTEGAGPSGINQAVSAVNELFDDCALTVACEDADIWFADVVADPSSGEEPQASEVTLAEDPEPPVEFELSVTSPVKGSSTISFAVPERSRVEVALFDASGRMVMRMEDRTVPAGLTRLPLDMDSRRRMPAGVYFVRVQATGLETGRRIGRAQKMILVR
jgi:hypothetical protein